MIIFHFLSHVNPDSWAAHAQHFTTNHTLFHLKIAGNMCRISACTVDGKVVTLVLARVSYLTTINYIGPLTMNNNLCHWGVDNCVNSRSITKLHKECSISEVVYSCLKKVSTVYTQNISVHFCQHIDKKCFDVKCVKPPLCYDAKYQIDTFVNCGCYDWVNKWCRFSQPSQVIHIATRT